jgi:hypothetical protein
MERTERAVGITLQRVRYIDQVEHVPDRVQRRASRLVRGVVSLRHLDLRCERGGESGEIDVKVWKPFFHRGIQRWCFFVEKGKFNDYISVAKVLNRWVELAFLSYNPRLFEGAGIYTADVLKLDLVKDHLRCLVPEAEDIYDQEFYVWSEEHFRRAADLDTYKAVKEGLSDAYGR